MALIDGFLEQLRFVNHCFDGSLGQNANFLIGWSIEFFDHFPCKGFYSFIRLTSNIPHERSKFHFLLLLLQCYADVPENFFSIFSAVPKIDRVILTVSECPCMAIESLAA